MTVVTICEEGSDELWFIGTKKCVVWVAKPDINIGHRRRRSKASIPRSKASIESSIK